jgi:hypothetical protein
VTKLVDGLVRNANHIQVDDPPPCGAFNDVDDAGEERLLGVACHDEGSRADSIGFCRLVEERPDVAGLVDLLYVGRQRNPHGIMIGHCCLPAWSLGEESVDSGLGIRLDRDLGSMDNASGCGHACLGLLKCGIADIVGVTAEDDPRIEELEITDIDLVGRF